MPATYVFKNASSIKYSARGRGCGRSHQDHIMAVLQSCGGLTRAALKAKLEAEDKAWIGDSKQTIQSIIDFQLTKLVKNGALEAVKPGVAELKERALAVGGDHATARALIKAEQTKAAAVKAKEYYLKQKAANFEHKVKVDLLEQENAALKGAAEAKATAFSENEAEMQAQIAIQQFLCAKAETDLGEVKAELQDAKAELQDAKAELQDAKAELAFAQADLQYQKVEVSMLKDELADEQRYAASLTKEVNHLNTEVTCLRGLLLLEFAVAVAAGIYFLVNYQPPVMQLQIGY